MRAAPAGGAGRSPRRRGGMDSRSSRRSGTAISGQVRAAAARASPGAKARVRARARSRSSPGPCVSGGHRAEVLARDALGEVVAARADDRQAGPEAVEQSRAIGEARLQVLAVGRERAVGLRQPGAPLGVGHPAVVEVHDRAEQRRARSASSRGLGAPGRGIVAGSHEHQAHRGRRSASRPTARIAVPRPASSRCRRSTARSRVLADRRDRLARAHRRRRRRAALGGTPNGTRSITDRRLGSRS